MILLSENIDTRDILLVESNINCMNCFSIRGKIRIERESVKYMESQDGLDRALSLSLLQSLCKCRLHHFFFLLPEQ